MTAPINVLLTESDEKKLKGYGSLTLWRELGFKVARTARSTFEGINAIEEGACRLLVTVNRPPEVDAGELLKRCAAQGMAAIVIVPRRDGESVGRYFGLNACDVIAEPPSRSRLRQSLMKAHRLISRGHASEEYRRAAVKAFSVLEMGGGNGDFILKLWDFIERSEGETATTGSAAEFFSFNRDYFGKLFKQETGMSFNSFYNGFRIEYAKELLISGSLRVCEISELLGFSSVDYFTTVFRRQAGCTPSCYRRRAAAVGKNNEISVKNGAAY